MNHFRNKNKINVSGKGVPVPIRAFEDLKTTYKISDRLLHNIRECGYNLPTPIQMQAIPIMLQVSLSIDQFLFCCEECIM